MRHSSSAAHEALLLAGLGAILLASRAVAATIPIATTDDTSAVACTLRDAIAAANTHAASGACRAGAGDDMVDLTGLTGRILLATALPALASNIQVRGPGAAGLTISGQDTVRVFEVSGGTVSIADLTISRGLAPGLFGAGDGVLSVAATLTLARVVVTLHRQRGPRRQGRRRQRPGGAVGPVTDSSSARRLVSGPGGG